MKKLIALILALVMCLAMAACGQEPAAEEPAAAGNSDLASAKEYLATMYRDAPSTHVEDYQVVGRLMVGDIAYTVEWTADSETVKFTADDSGMVTVDIDEKNPEELKYVMTATIADAEGNTETVSFEQRVPAAVIITEDMSDEDIVKSAYTLENGLSIADPETQTLTGKIVKIKDAYSEKYNNIGVIIQVGELEDMPVLCFRLSGEGIADLKEGDTITVTGVITNYEGTIEFDAGCTLDAIA